MLEKLAKSIEEVNVLAEHYRTCQNVAAIESLAKECFISKEDTDAFIAGKRKFLLKVLLTRQSGSVTEKLTEEMLLLQDSGYATVLGTYLLDLARKDPVMKDVILQPHKTLRHCLEYVHEKAYETALEKALNEVKAERSARDEAVRYIYVLLKLVGGHAIVHTRDLQRQKGRVMCNVSRGTGIVRMHIDYDFVGKGTKRCLKNSENLTVMRRSTARRPRS